MSLHDLRALWKLHQVDHAVLDIRNAAAALDPGRAILAEIKEMEAERDKLSAQAKGLHAEQKDLELQQKSITDKLKKIDKELYGGQVVNPREVETLEKEVQLLKQRRGDMDGRLLELWELVPPAEEEVAKVEARLVEKRKELQVFQKTVVARKAKLEAEFKRLNELRPTVLKDVPPSLLTRYEAIRSKHNGIAMAQTTKKGTCGACGTTVARTSIQNALEGRIVTCEECHRILYATEGVV